MKIHSHIAVTIAVAMAQIVGSVALACVDSVTPQSSPVLPANGAPGDLSSGFSVSSDPLCYWSPTITYQDPVGGWIIIETYQWDKDNPGALTYSVLPNSGDARTGTITVGGAPHTVTQAGSCQITQHSPLGGLGADPFGTDLLYLASTECLSIVTVTDGYLPLPKVPGSSYGGMVFGPDEMLYVGDTARGVFVIDPDTGAEVQVWPAGADFAPKHLRFNHRGDLFVTNNLAGQVYVFENAAGTPTVLTAPGSGALEGITFAADGDLLVADSANQTIWRFVFDPTTGGFSGAQPIDNNPSFDLSLTSPTGIARASNLKVLVGDGSVLYRVSVDGDGDASGQAECAAFPDGSVIQAVDISADDTLYVTVWNTTSDVGELYQLQFNTADSSCGLPAAGMLATFSGVAGGSVPPLVGVAVPYWRQAGQGAAFPNLEAGTQAVTFNDIVYEFTPAYTSAFDPDNDPECTVDIVAHEFSPNDPRVLAAIAKLQAAGDVVDARPIVNFGDNGRLQVFDFKPSLGSSTCTDQTKVEFFEHAISAYFSAFNPQYVICHGDAGLDDPQLDCRLATFKGYFPQFGFLPGDGWIGGFDPRFSQGFMIDAAPDALAYSGQFCGFQSPLAWPTSAGDPNLPEFQSGSDMPVKFTVANTSLGGNCQNGPYVTKTLTAVLSLARIKDAAGNPVFDVIDHLDVTGGGSYETDRIVFSNPTNKNKPFALQVKLSENGVNLPPGTYQVVVVDDTAASNAPGNPDTYYFPAQQTFFEVK